jgi:O-succinylbenzoate synthase
MDEGIVALTDLQEFHRLGCLDGVAMKVSRSGGITEARRMIHYLREHGLQYFASGLTDPDVALSACLHLFAATDLPHPAALNAPQFLEGSILRHPLPIVGDQASVPPGFGLGVEVDLAHPFLTQDTSAFGAL